jgi:glycosyltransferase involved in cell wall biosynthesis
LSAAQQTDGPDVALDLVSTWQQVCGVATYAGHLTSAPALSGTIRSVLAREVLGDALPTVDDIFVRRVWSADGVQADQLAAEIAALTGDILWFQHHPAFFSNIAMRSIAGRLPDGPHRVRVATLHNVREPLAHEGHGWLAAFDRLLVHTEADRQMLADAGYDNAIVIPHGIVPPSGDATPDPAHFTIGSFGFLYPHKNIPILVEAFAMARRIVPNLRLKLPCCAPEEGKAWSERAKLEWLIDTLDLADAIDLDLDFLPDDAVLDRLRACDLLCFPYGPSSESTTGAARMALSAGRPLLVSQSAVLRDLHPCAFALADLEPATIAEAIILLAADSALLTLRDPERQALIDRTSYDAIARRLRALFQQLLKDKADAA